MANKHGKKPHKDENKKKERPNVIPPPTGSARPPVQIFQKKTDTEETDSSSQEILDEGDDEEDDGEEDSFSDMLEKELALSMQGNEPLDESTSEDVFEDPPEGDDASYEDDASFDDVQEQYTLAEELFSSFSEKERGFLQFASDLDEKLIDEKQAIESAFGCSIHNIKQYLFLQYFNRLHRDSKSSNEVQKEADSPPAFKSPNLDLVSFLLQHRDSKMINLVQESGSSPVSYEVIQGNEVYLLLGINPNLASEYSFHFDGKRNLEKKSHNAAMPESIYIVPLSTLSRGMVLSEKVHLVDGFHPESKKVTPEQIVRAVEPEMRKENESFMEELGQDDYELLIRIALQDSGRFFSLCKKHNINLRSAMIQMDLHGFVYNKEESRFVQKENTQEPVLRDYVQQKQASPAPTPTTPTTPSLPSLQQMRRPQNEPVSTNEIPNGYMDILNNLAQDLRERRG